MTVCSRGIFKSCFNNQKRGNAVNLNSILSFSSNPAKRACEKKSVKGSEEIDAASDDF